MPPPYRSAAGLGLGGALGLIVAWIGWALMAFIGLAFIAVILFWVVVAILFSVIAGWLRGKPSPVTVIWRQYRDLMRGRWPQAPGHRTSSSTPRADSADSAAPPGASADTVQDVNWRDVPDDDRRR